VIIDAFVVLVDDVEASGSERTSKSHTDNAAASIQAVICVRLLVTAKFRNSIFSLHSE
jgi:hypothetical protein